MSKKKGKSFSRELTWEERHPTNYLIRPSKRYIELLEESIKRDAGNIEEISVNDNGRYGVKKIITVVAFRDDRPNSVAYKKFELNDDNDLEKVLRFYSNMLRNEGVRVISTRKVIIEE
ncbi:MAG: hypothetical protein DRP09_17980 [Candidatus Thorarchaeota archaeon]|nr:MAG: hypothetical protein DRP09_17980 [Candidatus Thorarchaeota archaeon]